MLFSCHKESALDPREIEKNFYFKKIRSFLQKAYPIDSTDNQEYYSDLFLLYYLEKTPDAFSRNDCKKTINDCFSKYNLIYFKPSEIGNLHSYCNNSISDLITKGNEYNQKTRIFDHYNLIAMYFYYNAQLMATYTHLDENYDYIPHVMQQGLESYTKFRKIRNQLSEDYINVSTYIPFFEYSSENK